jgi:outer membrane biogenesis lipoprotein LolB
MQTSPYPVFGCACMLLSACSLLAGCGDSGLSPKEQQLCGVWKARHRDLELELSFKSNKDYEVSENGSPKGLVGALVCRGQHPRAA